MRARWRRIQSLPSNGNDPVQTVASTELISVVSFCFFPFCSCKVENARTEQWIICQITSEHERDLIPDRQIVIFFKEGDIGKEKKHMHIFSLQCDCEYDEYDDLFITCALKEVCFYYSMDVAVTIYYSPYSTHFNGCDCRAQLTLRQFRQFVSIHNGSPFKVNKWQFLLRLLMNAIENIQYTKQHKTLSGRTNLSREE